MQYKQYLQLLKIEIFVKQFSVYTSLTNEIYAYKHVFRDIVLYLFSSVYKLLRLAKNAILKDL